MDSGTVTVGTWRTRRRLFHGRLRQQVTLILHCAPKGHEWGTGDEEGGVVTRRCERDCGTHRLASTGRGFQVSSSRE